ncbi:MAG TPA: hypothetical protein VJ884_05110 [Salinibacter sp.]|nr:hypothetical protein [Salinibacter sp.]
MFCLRAPNRFLPRVGGLAALMALLLGTSTAAASGWSTTPSGGSTDSLTAAAIAVELRYGAPPPPSAPLPRDRWLGRDKVKHVVVSGLWTLSTQYVLVNKANWTEADALPVSVASGATIGILKELYDASRLTGRASGKDLVADAVGIGLAVGVIAL